MVSTLLICGWGEPGFELTSLRLGIRRSTSHPPDSCGGGSVVSAHTGGNAGSIIADVFLTPDQGRLVGFIAIAEYERCCGRMWL